MGTRENQSSVATIHSTVSNGSHELLSEVQVPMLLLALLPATELVSLAVTLSSLPVLAADSCECACSSLDALQPDSSKKSMVNEEERDRLRSGGRSLMVNKVALSLKWCALAEEAEEAERMGEEEARKGKLPPLGMRGVVREMGAGLGGTGTACSSICNLDSAHNHKKHSPFNKAD